MTDNSDKQLLKLKKRKFITDNMAASGLSSDSDATGMEVEPGMEAPGHLLPNDTQSKTHINYP